MYRFDSGQICVDDCEQPIGMNVKSDNRWILKARKIPWEAIEERYARLFLSNKENEAKPLRLALGACISQSEYGYPDKEVGLQIQKNQYLQYFCSYKKYDDSKPPFDPSNMVHFSKRLNAEILGEINELILRKNQVADEQNDHDDDDNNRGTMIVEVTCAPSNIRFPQDESILNEAREWTEKIIDTLYDSKTGRKPHTCRQLAHKTQISFSKCRKKTRKQIRKAIGAQRRYVRRILKTIQQMQMGGKEITPLQQARLTTIQKLYEQQSDIYQNKTHNEPDRIVSLSQPFIRAIVRGKTRS